MKLKINIGFIIFSGEYLKYCIYTARHCKLHRNESLKKKFKMNLNEWTRLFLKTHVLKTRPRPLNHSEFPS